MSARPTALARRLGAFDASMIVMGGMIGAGIFVNPAVVAREVPSEALSLLAWAAGGGIALLGAFLYAELGERLPEAGGQYAYLREAWHPLLGFLYGWTLLLVTGSGGQAAVAMTFARYLRVLTGLAVPEGAAAVATLAAVAAVNLVGVRAGGTLQSVFTVTKAAAIALLVVAGLSLAPAAAAAPAAFAPAAGSLAAAFGAALVPVFFAYGGYQNTGFAAEELRNPQRDLPRGLLWGVTGVILLYVSVGWVSVRVLGPAGLAATGTPASDVMTRALGPAGGRLIALGIAVSTLGFLSHGVLTLPRATFAMARDGVFFQRVATLTPRTRVPAFAILAQAAVASALALSGKYEQILGFVMSVDVLFFAATGAALFVFRRRGGPAPRVTMPGHPATTLVFIAACLWVAVSAWIRYPLNSAAGLGLLSGVPAYLLLDEDEMTRATSSPYMEWAKTKKGARFNLSRSGVPDQPLAVLDATLADIEIDGGGGYGWAPLLGALGAHLGVPPEEIVHLPGTSMANFVALAGLLAPDDDVLIERPTYELLVSAARFLGANVFRFDRRFEDAFAVDPAAVARATTPKTKVIVLTNLHNPSSARIPDATLHAVGSLAREAGARVLVDEVYLEAVYETPTPTARRLGPELVVTSSLTKAWGFSGLRCGWIAAEPDLARRFARLNDLFGVIHSRPAETLALRALACLSALAPRFRELLASNRTVFREFLEARTDLEAVVPPDGTVVFPRRKHGSSGELCRLLRENYDTSAVPGEFFEDPRAFRVALSIPTEELREGLVRLGRALDDLAR